MIGALRRPCDEALLGYRHDRAAEAEGYAILLDGRPMRLPGGAVLRVGARTAGARAIAEEWQTAGGGKGGEMSFADTPLTRIAGTAQQRIAPGSRRPPSTRSPATPRATCCATAPRRPRRWSQRQAREWQPWLDWAALDLRRAAARHPGIAYVKQHRDSVAALRRAVAALDVLALAGLGVAVPALGSLVLGLALAEGRLDAATAHAAGCLDELFQAGAWGEDAQAAARRRAVADEIASGGAFSATDPAHDAT